MAATLSHVPVQEGLSWLQGSWTVFPSKHCQDRNSRVEQAGQADSLQGSCCSGTHSAQRGHRAMRSLSGKKAEDLFFCSLQSGKPWYPSHRNHGDQFMGGSVCCCFLISPPSLPPFLLSFPPSFSSPSFSSFLPPSPPPSSSSSLPSSLLVSFPSSLPPSFPPPSLPPSIFLLPFLPSLPPFFHLFFFFGENITLTHSHLSGIIPLAFQLLPRTVWQLDILQETQRWESKETEHLLPKEEASSHVREIDSSHQKHTSVVHVFCDIYQLSENYFYYWSLMSISPLSTNSCALCKAWWLSPFWLIKDEIWNCWAGVGATELVSREVKLPLLQKWYLDGRVQSGSLSITCPQHRFTGKRTWGKMAWRLLFETLWFVNVEPGRSWYSPENKGGGLVALVRTAGCLWRPS